MDADGLPIVGPGIDYTKVGAIHQKRTLAFLNHFITHTVKFLNHFSNVCEEKLEAMTIRLHRLETTMNLLEAKLSSIPGLENVTVATQPASTQPAANEPEKQTPLSTQQSSQAQVQSEEKSQSQPVPADEPPVQEKPKMTVSQDPRYAPYFKKAKVGVPLMPLKTRMIQEGLNPDLLDTPDAPAPDGDGAAPDVPDVKADSDSEAEFSDDDKAKESDDDSSGSGFSD